MAILDDILNKNKNKGANPFLPVTENDLEEKADNSPIVSDGTKTVTAQENMQAEQSAALPEVKYPSKPQGLNDDEYEHLLKYYSPEAITKFSAPFDPSSGGNIFERYYQSTKSKPVAPDEKKLRNRRVIAGIGDGLSMLSQMINAGSGAHVRERNDFALPKIQQQEKDDQNRYLQLSQQYNDGLLQTRLKDFQRSLDDYNNGRKGLRDMLAVKQNLDQAQTQFENKQRFEYDKLAQEQKNKDRDYDLRETNQKSLDAQRDAYIKQGWSRVVDSRNKAIAYVQEHSSSSGKNGNYQLIFEANPNDGNAQTDNLGNKVRTFDMTKGQIDQYARKALSDPQFMARHQYLILQKPDMIGSGSYKYKPNQDIAAAYLLEHYNKHYSSPPNRASKQKQVTSAPWYNPDSIFQSDGKDGGWDWLD